MNQFDILFSSLSLSLTLSFSQRHLSNISFQTRHLISDSILQQINVKTCEITQYLMQGNRTHYLDLQPLDLWSFLKILYDRKSTNQKITQIDTVRLQDRNLRLKSSCEIDQLGTFFKWPILGLFFVYFWSFSKVIQILQ